MSSFFALATTTGLAHEHQFLLRKNEKVEEFEDAGGVNYEQGDVPVALVVPCCFPERETFPKKGPDGEEGKAGTETGIIPVHHAPIGPITHHKTSFRSAIISSVPLLKVNNRSPVAQSVERLAVNEDVVGSSPTGGAMIGVNIFKSLIGSFYWRLG